MKFVDDDVVCSYSVVSRHSHYVIKLVTLTCMGCLYSMTNDQVT